MNVGERAGTAGVNGGGRARAWVLAMRLRTLPAAVVPVLVGTAAAARAGHADLPIAALALVVALALQIGTNLVNDWGDFRRGADGPDRLGPVRVTQAGLVTPRAVAAAGAAAFVTAALVGLVLVMRAGLPALAIGAAAVVAGVAYTAGPYPLAYHGLGELFVFVFFGPVAVCGTELVQAGRVSETSALAAIPVGCLAVAILVVNNVRDVDGDRRAGKRTLAVRGGRGFGRALYCAALAVAFAAPPLLVARGLAGPAALLALASLPLAVAPVRAVLTRTDGSSLNAALAATARLHLAFGVLLAQGLAR